MRVGVGCGGGRAADEGKGGAGGQLFATYYDDTEVTGWYARDHSTLTVSSLNWGTTAPSTALTDALTWSTRWRGYISPATADTYTFYTDIAGTDEGVRLWVNGQPIIDVWSTTPAALELTGTVSLGVAGALYQFVVEYKQVSSTAQLALLWSATAVPKAAIPTTRLYSFNVTAGPLPSVIVVPGAWVAWRLVGEGRGEGRVDERDREDLRSDEPDVWRGRDTDDGRGGGGADHYGAGWVRDIADKPGGCADGEGAGDSDDRMGGSGVHGPRGVQRPGGGTDRHGGLALPRHRPHG